MCWGTKRLFPYQKEPVRGWNGWISLCCPSDPWYLRGSRGAITMMMCFASWSFCPLKNRIRSFVCVWNICLWWSGFSQIHVLIYGREIGYFKGRNSGYPWMCTAPIRGYCSCGMTCCPFPPKLIILGAISALDTLWDALWAVPCKQRELPCCASCSCSSTRGGSFPFRGALLFPAVVARGAFQEGDEEARLNGLKSGFTICEGRPGSCFSLTVSRWCCWNTKISSVFGMAALRPPAPQHFLCSSTILQA